MFHELYLEPKDWFQFTLATRLKVKRFCYNNISIIMLNNYDTIVAKELEHKKVMNRYQINIHHKSWWLGRIQVSLLTEAVLTADLKVFICKY